MPERLAHKADRSDYYFRPDPYVIALAARVEEVLESVVSSGDSMLAEIGRHMLFGYAKRLRPIFVLLAQQLFREEVPESSVECAAAAELIHCASLFHDDVIDEATTRKGFKAANAVWGNKSAVIVGDQFFVLAYNLLTKLRDFRIIEFYVDMCRSLAEGVMMEIKNTGNLDITEDTHFEIVKRKTALFFQTVASVGGYLGGAAGEHSGHLAAFGLNFGLAFQFSDDLLDLFSDPVATGKPRGADLRSGIYTTPIIHALAHDSVFKTRFAPALRNGGIEQDTIDEIAEALISNGSMDYSKGLVKLYGEKASSHLDLLPACRANDAFRDLLGRIVSREYRSG